MEKLKCIICGNELTGIRAKKYCSPECRAKARKILFDDWKIRTNYNEKKKLKMREVRSKKLIDEAVRKEADHAEKLKLIDLEAKRRQKERNESILQSAKAGDPFSRMIIAISKGGIKNPEYWEAFKDYEINRSEGLNTLSETTVNGISVYDDDFGVKIIESIEILGSITTRTEYKKHTEAKEDE